MIQLKDTKNWEITQDHPRTGHTPKKLKPYKRGSGETHEEQ